MVGQRADRALQELLAESLGQESGLAPDVCDEIAFHLVDWNDELLALTRLMEEPDAFTGRERYQIIMQFLIHATSHCMAASELLLGYPAENVFREE